MKTSAALWKSNKYGTAGLPYPMDAREAKRKRARSQKTKIKTNKTNKGFK